MNQSLHETPGREDYYNAALTCVILCCESCDAVLDPDKDLGQQLNFHSDRYYVHLGDEAFHRGWKITQSESDIGFRIQCPSCAGIPS